MAEHSYRPVAIVQRGRLSALDQRRLVAEGYVVVVDRGGSDDKPAVDIRGVLGSSAVVALPAPKPVKARTLVRRHLYVPGVGDVEIIDDRPASQPVERAD